MCKGADLTVYGAIGRILSARPQSVATAGLWLNAELATTHGLPGTSRAPMMAHWKLGEVVAFTPDLSKPVRNRTDRYPKFKTTFPNL